MLTLEFINVGYGDAVLVEETSEDGQVFRMLVDCGDTTPGVFYPGSQRITAAEYLKKKRISRLDLLVLTHLHRDHVGGLQNLLAETEVGELWTNYLPNRIFWERRLPACAEFSPGAQALLQAMNIYLSALCVCEGRGTKIVEAACPGTVRFPGAALRIRRFGGQAALYRRQRAIWEQQFLQGPCNASLNELDGFINNTSLRMRLWREGFSAELPGDTYAACWEKHRVAPCTLVKLPHHGHADSLTEGLYGRLAPQYVVISTSNDRIAECPSMHIVEMAGKREGALLCTDAIEKEGVPRHVQQALGFRVGKGGEVAVYHVQKGETPNEML